MQRWAGLLFAIACGVFVAMGCGAGKGGFAPDGGLDGDVLGGTLVVEPADFVLALSEGQAGTVDYKAFRRAPDGKREDVTAQATFTVEMGPFVPALGSFTGARFNAAPDKVGKTRVTASVGAESGATTLTVSAKRTIIGPGAPPDAATKFGGPVDAARKPTVVYPDSGTLVPPNMNELELQYMPGPQNDLFDLYVTGTYLELHVYFGCQAVGGGCGYVFDKKVWSLIGSAGRGEEPLTYALRATNKSAPTSVGVADPRTIGFGEEDLLGGIYYWDAAGVIKRWEFGVSGQKSETYLSAPQVGALTCVGCHVLSRDGKRIAVGQDIPAPSPYKVFDVGTKSMTYAGQEGANFFAFSPDNAQIVTSNGASLVLRDAANGTSLGTIAPSGAMPDWSPDGKTIVYAKPSMPVGFPAPGVNAASIEALRFANNQWLPGLTLVPFQGQNNYYPSISADGAWVLFNRSPSNHESYDAPDAEVWAISTTATPPVKLARFGSQNGDSWPKWLPTAQKYRGKTLLWLTVSSRRAYGLRAAGGPMAAAQLWMTAFDPEKAAKGEDPSYPGFWLPFQELASGNHIAQWVTRVERKPCGNMGECEASEACVNGKCIPLPK